MARGNGMSRRFHVMQDFDKFHKGEEVEVVLNSDYLSVEGGGAELKVPYNEIQYVAHCEKPETRMMGMVNSTPFFFGGGSLASLVAESAASVGMLGAETAAIPNFIKFLFMVGYYEGNDERWITLEDEHNYDTRPFAQELASCAHTRVIHYFLNLQRLAY